MASTGTDPARSRPPDGSPPGPPGPSQQQPGRHRARHRAERSARTRRSRRWPVLLLAVVLVVGAALIVVRVQRSGSTDRNPVIALPQPPSSESLSVVHGTLTLTDNCLTVAQGILVWPVGTQWDAGSQTVTVTYDKTEAVVGQELAMRGSVVDAIPSRPSADIPESLLARLRSCARSTGITSVAVVG